VRTRMGTISAGDVEDDADACVRRGPLDAVKEEPDYGGSGRRWTSNWQGSGWSSDWSPGWEVNSWSWHGSGWEPTGWQQSGWLKQHWR